VRKVEGRVTHRSLPSGYFVTEHTGKPFWKLFLKWTQAGAEFQNPFFPGIGFKKLGLSCYHITLLSNKLTYFVQLLIEKLTPSHRILGYSMRSGTHFFRKVAMFTCNMFSIRSVAIMSMPLFSD
jgi:hypothetical protein